MSESVAVSLTSHPWSWSEGLVCSALVSSAPYFFSDGTFSLTRPAAPYFFSDGTFSLRAPPYFFSLTNSISISWPIQYLSPDQLRAMSVCLLRHLFADSFGVCLPYVAQILLFKVTVIEEIFVEPYFCILAPWPGLKWRRKKLMFWVPHPRIKRP